MQGLPSLVKGARSREDEDGSYIDNYIKSNVESDSNIYVGIDRTIPDTLMFMLDTDYSRKDVREKKRWSENGFYAGNCRDLITPSNLVIQEWVLPIADSYRWDTVTDISPARIQKTWTIPVFTENNSYIRTDAKCQGCSPSRHPGSSFFLVSGNEIVLHGQCDYCKLNSCLTTCGQGEVSLYSSTRKYICFIQNLIRSFCQFSSEYAINDQVRETHILPKISLTHKHTGHRPPATTHHLHPVRPRHVEYMCKNRNMCMVRTPTPLIKPTTRDENNTFFHNRNVPVYGHKDVGDAIIAFPDPPVKHCFPCEYSRYNPLHYANTPKSSTLNQDINDWYCAGGESPPRSCHSNEFTVTAAHDKCECKPGTYLNPDTKNTCLLCAKGHFCVHNVSQACPMHQYQKSTGMSSCDNCVETGDEFGWYKGCGEGTQLQFCNPAYPESQNTVLEFNCLECSKCRKRYAEVVVEMRDCYKNTN